MAEPLPLAAVIPLGEMDMSEAELAFVESVAAGLICADEGGGRHAAVCLEIAWHTGMLKGATTRALITTETARSLMPLLGQAADEAEAKLASEST